MNAPASVTRSRLSVDEVDALKERVAQLEGMINTPLTADWFEGVKLEAAHQQERWGTEHDAGKTAWDWFWLIGYLAQKAAARPLPATPRRRSTIRSPPPPRC